MSGVLFGLNKVVLCYFIYFCLWASRCMVCLIWVDRCIIFLSGEEVKSGRSESKEISRRVSGTVGVPNLFVGFSICSV